MTPLDLLTRDIPAAVAATLFGAPVGIFADARAMTLLGAWRIALRGLRDDLREVRARKRRPLRQAIAAQHRTRTRHVPADNAAQAAEALSERLAGELDRLAVELTAVDPRAAVRMRKSAAGIRVAGKAEAARLCQAARAIS